MPAELLSDLAIRNAKPQGKPRKLTDGNGLTVLIHPNGSKYFQLRYYYLGKEKTLQLGTYPELTLAEARVAALAARKLVSSGVDPVQAKRKQNELLILKAETTFRAVSEEWLKTKNKNSPSYIDKIQSTFNANIYPRIGNIPISEISSAKLLSVLRIIEGRGALELLSKTRAWVRQVFDYAKATGKLAGENPAACLIGIFKQPEVTGYPTFKNTMDAGMFMRRLAEYQGKIETSIAIWLLMLTAKRPSEIRGARWDEFDFKKAEWTIPKERMKSRHSHTVTLSRQAVEALKKLKKFSGDGDFLFPGNDPTKPISEMTLTKAFKVLWSEYRIVPHGCRHFFSTMANEHGHFRIDVIEAALAHKDRDAIRARYNRASYLDERRKLSQWWADELELMRDSSIKKKI